MQSANDELEEEKASLVMQVAELIAQLEARMDDLRRDKVHKQGGTQAVLWNSVDLNYKIILSLSKIVLGQNEKFYLMKHLEEAKQTIEKGKASEEALRQMVDKLQDEKV